MTMVFNTKDYGADQAHLNSKIRIVFPRTLMASMGLKPAYRSVEKSADFPGLSIQWLCWRL